MAKGKTYWKCRYNILLGALKQIREVGYKSQLVYAADSLMQCILIAESAIGEAEKNKRIPKGETK